MNERRRLLKEYIRDDTDEELDYFTIMPYSDGEPYVSRIALETPYYVKMTNGSEYYSDIWYSVDGGEWVLYSEGFIDVPSLSKIRFKGNWHEIMKDVQFIQENVSEFYTPKFYSESGYDWWLLEGTPLSLLHGDNFKERKNDWNPYWDNFYTIFENSQSVAQINNPKTFLPSTELGECCYQEMFAGSLIANAPELPAETLKYGCYYRMFADNRYLEEAPALNAKTLAPYCYYQMFYDCIYLRYAKVTAKEGFYDGDPLTDMFYGCYYYGLAVLSQELIDSQYNYYFFDNNWEILTEDYPTNDEGYPEIKGDQYVYNVACFNIEFKERVLENGRGHNAFLSGPNELAKLLFDNIVSNVPANTTVEGGNIFINRMPVVELMWIEEEKDGKTVALLLFSFSHNGSINYSGIINEDGSISLEVESGLIYDYIKK